MSVLRNDCYKPMRHVPDNTARVAALEAEVKDLRDEIRRTDDWIRNIQKDIDKWAHKHW